MNQMLTKTWMKCNSSFSGHFVIEVRFHFYNTAYVCNENEYDIQYIVFERYKMLSNGKINNHFGFSQCLSKSNEDR